MPSTSKKQHNFMEMIAHGGKPRGGKGPSVAVAKDFVAADKASGAFRKPTGRIPRGGDNGGDTASRPVQVGKVPGYNGPGHAHIRAHRRRGR